MANATIYSNASSVLSWTTPSSTIAITNGETTTVTNSYGATVYWSQGGSSGSVANNGTMQCDQGPTKKKWTYSESSGGAARITLTVTGSGNSPSGKSQGQGHGQSDEE